MSEGFEIKCPYCNSEVVYRYGKARTGKQRFKCLMCGRQFTFSTTRSKIKTKPFCPTCGKLMHVYRKEARVIRFRCSNYPICKTYKKVEIEEESNELLHS
jgi:transposase-like protein